MNRLLEKALLLLLAFVSYSDAAGDEVGLSYVNDAKSLGAVCLDGSRPTYHLLRGYGSGWKNWHLHLEGGGWCSSQEDCARRAETKLGSSKYMETTIPFTGILSNNPRVNPDFYNWNHVYLRYCDGASFSADADEPLRLPSGEVLYFRGKRVFKAIIDELKHKGMLQTQQILLSGCSAGGLAAIHRCNDLQNYFPYAKVKCLSDAGFFVNAPDKSGKYSLYEYYKKIVNFHDLEEAFPEACTTTRPATQCFFPQVMQAYVRPPVFIMNAAYDPWQLDHVKKISQDEYRLCKANSSRSCSGLRQMHELRDTMMRALSYAKVTKSSGLFINSCFTHCQVQSDAWKKRSIGGKHATEAVGDWYFDRRLVKFIETAYPHNTGCI